MLRTPVAEALGAASAASEIRIGGWVRTRRDAKGFSFLELNDGSCLGNIQCIVDEGTAAWTNWKASTRARASPLRANLSSRRQRPEMGSAGQGYDRVRPRRS